MNEKLKALSVDTTKGSQLNQLEEWGDMESGVRSLFVYLFICVFKLHFILKKEFKLSQGEGWVFFSSFFSLSKGTNIFKHLQIVKGALHTYIHIH